MVSADAAVTDLALQSDDVEDVPQQFWDNSHETEPGPTQLPDDQFGRQLSASHGFADVRLVPPPQPEARHSSSSPEPAVQGSAPSNSQPGTAPSSSQPGRDDVAGKVTSALYELGLVPICQRNASKICHDIQPESGSSFQPARHGSVCSSSQPGGDDVAGKVRRHKKSRKSVEPKKRLAVEHAIESADASPELSQPPVAVVREVNMEAVQIQLHNDTWNVARDQQTRRSTTRKRKSQKIAAGEGTAMTTRIQVNSESVPASGSDQQVSSDTVFAIEDSAPGEAKGPVPKKDQQTRPAEAYAVDQSALEISEIGHAVNDSQAHNAANGEHVRLDEIHIIDPPEAISQLGLASSDMQARAVETHRSAPQLSKAPQTSPRPRRKSNNSVMDCAHVPVTAAVPDVLPQDKSTSQAPVAKSSPAPQTSPRPKRKSNKSVVDCAHVPLRAAVPDEFLQDNSTSQAPVASSSPRFLAPIETNAATASGRTFSFAHSWNSDEWQCVVTPKSNERASVLAHASPFGYALLRLSRPVFVPFQILVILALHVAFEREDDGSSGLEGLFPGSTALQVHADCEDLRFQIWRWWLYQFSHVDAKHVVMNAFTVMYAVPQERFQGTKRVALMFNVGVLGGACAVFLFDIHSTVVGMSAGGYAILSIHLADLLLNWKEKQRPWLESIAFIGMLAIVACEAYIMWDEPVSHATHLGGAIGGFLTGVGLGRVVALTSVKQRVQRVALASLVCLFLLSLCWLFFVWPPRNIWEPSTPWCWTRQIYNRTVFDDYDWKCVRCPDLHCAAKWSHQQWVETVSEKTCMHSLGGWSSREP